MARPDDLGPLTPPPESVERVVSRALTRRAPSPRPGRARLRTALGGLGLAALLLLVARSAPPPVADDAEIRLLGRGSAVVAVHPAAALRQPRPDAARSIILIQRGGTP